MESEALEAALGYHFASRELLARAFTHRSSVHEKPSSAAANDNEQLEFLGDAILGFVVSDALVAAHPDYPEGRLSKLKAQLVSASHLHAVAARLRLGDYLLLGRGEEMSGGREKKALLANAVEALIAALYLDGGMEPARRFIVQHVIGEAEPSSEVALATDYKSALQELAQSMKLPQPRYAIVEERGPEHAKTFLVEVRVGRDWVSRAEGLSKKSAGQKAAQEILRKLTEVGNLGARRQRRRVRFAFAADFIQDDDIDPAVFSPALLGLVLVDGGGVGITGDGEPLACDAVLGEELHQRDAARGRELPVAAKSRVVDGNGIGMAFGAGRIPHLVHGVGDLLDGGIEIGRDLIFAGRKQRGLGEADGEAARGHVEGQAAALDLWLQAPCDRIGSNSASVNPVVIADTELLAA